ncbi:MAG TPA: GNAT family N-acetyltransferase [Anaerolineae bacterium]|nr:GNAT family N-acetyltransferase [Anaerolineae bacterium]
MKDFAVRPFARSDLPQLMGLDHSSTTDHVWQLELRRDAKAAQVSAVFREVRLPRPVRLMYPNDPSALADEWKQRAMISTAVSGTAAVGYIGLTRPRAGVSWITDLAVSPQWRRKGVGGSLLEAAHIWCVGQATRKIFFETQSKNYPAIKLAQKHAYEFCGYNDRYYSSQDITLFFVRVL